MDLNTSKRYDELIKEIERHDKLYEAGTPEIGDGEYDDLYFELLTIEKENPNDVRNDSPSQKINTELVSSLPKKEHEQPMLSQNKTKTYEGIRSFVEKDINGDVIIGEKLDGLTVVLEYLDGKLNTATTRGNGYVGEVITHNVKTIKNVPKKIPFKKKLTLRGEGLMLIEEFNNIIAKGFNYSNPRNLASGTLRQLDASICAERNMIIKIFDIVYAEDMNFKSDTEAMNWIKSIGFDIVTSKTFKRGDNISDEIISYIEEYSNKIRDSLPYMIDGMVLKSDDYDEREKLGYTSKWPKWAIAYKFKAQEATSTLRDVIPQVGKTGQITPVAVFDKVNIDVDIQRATLSNYNLIEKLNLEIGDTISIIRSNDVIPKVTAVTKKADAKDSKKILVPKTCPICGSITEFIGENLYCTGTNCPAQIKLSLVNFTSRNAMNINGLGKETISDFYERGFVKSIQDIYCIEKYSDEICKLEGYGEKKLKNILNGIEETKKRELNNVILSLSIRLIGDSTAKDVAKHFKSLDSIVNLAKDKDKFFEECLKIEDFGDAKTESLYSYFSNPENIKLIEFLKTKGVNPKVEEKITVNNKFIEGKIFVITGDLNHYKNRDELKNEILNNGGKCSGSVSKKTTYLINNDIASESGKNKDAKKLGIPIISEEEFIKLKGE